MRHQLDATHIKYGGDYTVATHLFLDKFSNVSQYLDDKSDRTIDTE